MSRKPRPAPTPAGAALPIVIYASDTVDAARQLIVVAGSPKAARSLITEAAKRTGKKKKARGAPVKEDTHWLLIADAIQRHDLCSRREALKQAAHLGATEKDLWPNRLDRFQHKLKALKCKTLAEFAARQDVQVMCVVSATRIWPTICVIRLNFCFICEINTRCLAFLSHLSSF
jgi:hypothetical protein